MPAIARLVARAQAEVVASLGRLQSVCLVRCDEAQRYLAVSPALAEAQALGAEELELTTRRGELEARRMTIRQVVPQWTEQMRKQVQRDRGRGGATTPSRSANVLMHYAETCQTEVLSVSPGTRARTELDGRSRMATLYSLDRGRAHPRDLRSRAPCASAPPGPTCAS